MAESQSHEAYFEDRQHARNHGSLMLEGSSEGSLTLELTRCLAGYACYVFPRQATGFGLPQWAMVIVLCAVNLQEFQVIQML